MLCINTCLFHTVLVYLRLHRGEIFISSLSREFKEVRLNVGVTPVLQGVRIDERELLIMGKNLGHEIQNV